MRNDVKSTTWSSLKLIYFSAIVIKDDSSSHLLLIFYFDWWLMGEQEHNSLLLFFHWKKNKILIMNLPVDKVYVNIRNCWSSTGVIYHITIECLQNKNRKDSPVVNEKKLKTIERKFSCFSYFHRNWGGFCPMDFQLESTWQHLLNKKLLLIAEGLFPFSISLRGCCQVDSNWKSIWQNPPQFLWKYEKRLNFLSIFFNFFSFTTGLSFLFLFWKHCIMIW